MTEVKTHFDDDRQEGLEGGQKAEKMVTLTTEGQAEEVRQKEMLRLTNLEKTVFGEVWIRTGKFLEENVCVQTQDTIKGLRT